MKKASLLFSEEQKEMIQTAVLKAESNTSGEIVPVVATKSGRYERAEDIFGLLFVLISLIACWLLFERIVPVTEQWGNDSPSQIPLVYSIITIILSFFIGAKLASAFPSLSLIFIAKKQMQEEVERSAAEAFHHFRLSETQDATGILIYVSLFEHTVTVMGDKGINEKIQQPVWEEICTLTLDGIKKGNPAEGLVNAIEQCGTLLAKSFPILPSDTNELSNELQLID